MRTRCSTSCSSCRWGWGSGWRGSHGGGRLAIAFATTCTVEFLQLRVIAGRDASISDIITNTTGGLVGAWMAERWRSLIFPAPQMARRWAIGAGVAWVLMTAATGWLEHPSPTHALYYGQWAAELPGYEQFRGKVLAATVDGVATPSTRLTETPELRRRMRQTIIVRVTAVMAGPTGGVAPIFGIFDRNQNGILMLAQQGEALTFYVRMRVEGLRLRPPTLELRPGIPLEPGDTVQITGTLADSRLGITVSSPRGTSSRRLSVSPNWGWETVFPYDYAFGPAGHFLTALWVGGLLFPIGYWSRRGRSAVGALATGALLIVIGQGVVPVVTGLQPVHWSAWLAAAIGFLAGVGLAGAIAGRVSAVTSRRAAIATS